MRRVYKLPHKDFVCSGPPQGLLTNGFGSYVALDDSLSYQGWYVLQPKRWRMQKIIESITPLDEGECVSFYNQLFAMRREFASGAQDTFSIYQKILFYTTLNMKGRLRITFDHRESYEQSRLGRIYDVAVENDFVLVSFIQREGQGEEYRHYVGIKGIRDVELLSQWREKTYTTDKRRNAASSYWVFDAFTCKPGHHVVFASAQTKAEARTLADIAYYHFDDIISSLHERKLFSVPTFPTIFDQQLRAATQLASDSLQSLHQRFTFDHRFFTGVLAGLPWFFQLWSRDELISLGGLLSLAQQQGHEHHLEAVRTILKRHMNSIRADGTLANRYPHSDLGSIDAFGWLAKRTVDFLKLAQNTKQLYTLLSPEDLVHWHDALSKGLQRSKQRIGVGGQQGTRLFSNKFCETWMDTSYHDDGRAGVRIEIQALYYAVYEALIYIGKLIRSKNVEAYKREQRLFKQAVRQHFFDKKYGPLLVDGKDDELNVDKTYRPNVFLAAYIAQDLCTKEEWKRIFENHLRELYVSWGGLRTIGKEHPLYQPSYTGEDNKSYHRGDVWYFVNNLAALMLFRIDKDGFKHVIDQLVNASAQDILELGFAGHASEVSSAHAQEAHGCYAQAWSAATYLELMSELYPADE